MRVCACVFGGRVGRSHVIILWKNTDSLHTRYTVVAPVQSSGVRSVYASTKKVWPQYHGASTSPAAPY